jgi:hypothetical protein
MLCFTATLPKNVAAQKQMYLTIAAGGMRVSGDAPARFHYLAGSYAQFLIVVRMPDGTAMPIELHGKPVEWPQGLTIAVSTEDGISHPEWLDEMQIHPYLPWIDAISDPSRRNERKAKPGEYGHEHYDFIFTIPAAASGHSLVLSASFNHPEHGRLETKKPAVMEIVAPQTEEDRHFVWGTQIYYTKESGDYERAMALADSFIAGGYTGLEGLASAQTAAVFSKHYDAALRYMDLNMAANGTFRIERGSDLPDLTGQTPSKEELRRARADKWQPEYQRLRNDYLQKIAEQQKQER